MKLILMIVIGYVIGSINPAYLIARARGFDIRRRGSGNAGASNALIVMGKKAGLVSALFDIFKAFAVVKIAQHLLPSIAYAGIVSGVSCVFGHVFPLFMHFHGGKGLACLGGLILAFDYRLFLVMFILELILVLIVDYICVVPISASIAFPLIYKILTGDTRGSVALGIMALLIFYKHIENIKRIRSGAEAHFSFLWKRNQEVERLRDTVEDDMAEEKEE
ncbi:MAG: glycerol-3-phosphate acyltransferase [Ruminococcaceae bacterium]|nr:glycerol-3-phosphate acyltransferase [Oscillospiraceae bacterium]